MLDPFALRGLWGAREQDRRPVVIGGECSNSKGRRHGGDAGLPRPDPLGAEVDGRPVVAADGVGASPDAVARLQHDHIHAARGQLARGSQPSQARPDDDDVSLTVAREGPHVRSS